MENPVIDDLWISALGRAVLAMDKTHHSIMWSVLTYPCLEYPFFGLGSSYDIYHWVAYWRYGWRHVIQGTPRKLAILIILSPMISKVVNFLSTTENLQNMTHFSQGKSKLQTWHVCIIFRNCTQWHQILMDEWASGNMRAYRDNLWVWLNVSLLRRRPFLPQCTNHEPITRLFSQLLQTFYHI